MYSDICDAIVRGGAVRITGMRGKMRCPSCGREVRDDSNYCFYCAYSFRDHRNEEEGSNRPRLVSVGNSPTEGVPVDKPITGEYKTDDHRYPDTNNLNNINFDDYAQVGPRTTLPDGTTKITMVKKKPPLKTWQWILYFLLLFFPYTLFVWFGITAYWAISPVTPDERKNFARGVLISVLAITLFVLVAMVIIIQNGGLDKFITEMTNGAATSADAYYDMIYGK